MTARLGVVATIAATFWMSVALYISHTRQLPDAPPMYPAQLSAQPYICTRPTPPAEVYGNPFKAAPAGAHDHRKIA
jgi:hypothetical protein